MFTYIIDNMGNNKFLSKSEDYLITLEIPLLYNSIVCKQCEEHTRFLEVEDFCLALIFCTIKPLWHNKDNMVYGLPDTH